jgi:predicted HicB family RNase H-like nuclease
MPESDALSKLGAPILVAVATGGLTYLNSLRLAQRKEQLEFVERQLRDLYGPLLALCTSNNMAYHKAFRLLYRPDIPMWDPPVSEPENWPSEDDIAAFRMWTKEVFMPINREMCRLVVDHTDLLVEPSMPQCLLDLLAHVQAYEGLIQEWETGKTTHNTPKIRFPGEIMQYVMGNYQALKKTQATLQGRFSKPRMHWLRCWANSGSKHLTGRFKRRFSARIEYNSKTDMFQGKILGLGGGADFYGANPEQLRQEFRESLNVFLEVCREKGIEPRKQFSGKINLRIPAELHEMLAMAAQAQGKSLNSLAQEVLEKGVIA